MFDMGFQEIILIGIIALIIIGPERLPAVARNIGKYVGKMQRFVAGVKSDIASELQTDELRSMLTSQEDQIRELKSMVKETQSDLEKTAKQAKESVSEGMDSAVAQVKDAADAAKATANENSAKMQDIARAAGYNTYGDMEDTTGSDNNTDSKATSPETNTGPASSAGSEGNKEIGSDVKDQDSSKSA